MPSGSMWYILCWYFFFFFSFFFWCWKWIFVYVHRFWFLLSLSAVAGLLLLLVLMVFRFSIACAPLSIINAHGVMPACEWVDFRSEPHHTVHMHKINKVIANNNGSARALTPSVCVCFWVEQNMKYEYVDRLQYIRYLQYNLHPHDDDTMR